ncbi:hypothetical protein AN948_01915 [Rhodococcus sp. ADH]|uniref:YwaF family protein n=1 Tax=Rhodococcus TaxID=1827 RepID=UPI0006BA44F5|nr:MULTISPECIES: TIGR02206 family membrane protein [Rhodococcus]KPH21414.1 hypothetical protein AN948_01915 [Rhodococcus sp. ADH]MEA1798746.1 TIGR02206 family membrane protein [Rhodococcus qingshengii]RGP47366.1 hypothetical protein AWH04_08520 [Rhodococcus erythropolis]
MYIAQQAFSAYGPSYWAVIALFASGALLLVLVGRRQTEVQARRFGRLFGAVTGAIYGSAMVYSAIPFSIGSSVPLQLTDLVTAAAAYALWSQRHWAFSLTYYWGLVLSTQALISPVLAGPDFPSYEFLAFWAIHLLVVWAAIYLTWGRGMRPGWGSYKFAIASTAAWATVAFTFNIVAGTNYGFLNAKPVTASLLDVMGPWPVYLATGSAVLLLVWGLMTWLWQPSLRRPG